MSVTEIQPGRLVMVGDTPFGSDDIIELAEALIEENGWVKGDGGNASKGWSIHGAIGEASGRAYGGNSSQKGGTKERPLRDDAAQKVSDADMAMRSTPDVPAPRRNEMQINDSAQSVDEVLAVMRAARGADRRHGNV
jgi:hypothetical protein